MGDTRKRALSTLASAAETAEGTSVLGDIEAGLLLELLLEVVQEVVVEVLTAEMSITSSGLHSEDTSGDVEERDIEGSTTKIEDENITLAFCLLIKAVGNGSSCRLVDNTEHVKTSNSTRILGCKTLRVIEIGRDTWLSPRLE